jgi:uncharacterized protein (DUF433 family)
VIGEKLECSSTEFVIFVKKNVMGQLERITINQAVCHGKPCIRRMRWPVEVIIDMLGSGMTIDQIIDDHPELEKEDIQASLNFAKLVISGRSINEAV